MQTETNREQNPTFSYLVTGPHNTEHCKTQRVDAISAEQAWMSVVNLYADVHGLSVSNCTGKFTVRKA